MPPEAAGDGVGGEVLEADSGVRGVERTLFSQRCSRSPLLCLGFVLDAGLSKQKSAASFRPQPALESQDFGW